MIHLNISLNVPCVIPFISEDHETGLTSFPVSVIKDGVLVSLEPPISFSEIGGGIYTATMVFSEIGAYAIVIQGKMVSYVNVMRKDIYTIVKDLDDVALGSWVWDKQTGSLTLVRQDGNPLATFEVSDSVNQSSRERT